MAQGGRSAGMPAATIPQSCGTSGPCLRISGRGFIVLRRLSEGLATSEDGDPSGRERVGTGRGRSLCPVSDPVGRPGAGGKENQDEQVKPGLGGARRQSRPDAKGRRRAEGAPWLPGPGTEAGRLVVSGHAGAHGRTTVLSLLLLDRRSSDGPRGQEQVLA